MELVTTYLQSVVPTIMLTIIQVIVAVVGVFTVRFINRMLKKTGLEIDQQMMVDIEDIVLKAVCITNQTLTEAYKAASPDHKLNPEQAAELFEHTKEIIMSSLSHEQVQAIVNRFGTDIDEAIKYLIENTVYWNH